MDTNSTEEQMKKRDSKVKTNSFFLFLTKKRFSLFFMLLLIILLGLCFYFSQLNFHDIAPAKFPEKPVMVAVHN